MTHFCHSPEASGPRQPSVSGEPSHLWRERWSAAFGFGILTEIFTPTCTLYWLLLPESASL